MKKNTIATILIGIGIAVMVIGLLYAFFSSIFMSRNGAGSAVLLPALMTIVYWFIIGMLFIGLAEAIKLLQQISNKLGPDSNLVAVSKNTIPLAIENTGSRSDRYGAMRLVLKKQLYDGVLEISEDRVHFNTEELDKIIDFPRSAIYSCFIDDETPIQTNLVIMYRDQYYNDVEIILYPRSNDTTIVRDLYRKLNPEENE